MTTAALSPREHEVMASISNGATSRQIGTHLGISPRTVEIHRANAITKLGAINATQAAVFFDRLSGSRAVPA